MRIGGFSFVSDSGKRMTATGERQSCSFYQRSLYPGSLSTAENAKVCLLLIIVVLRKSRRGMKGEAIG